MKVNANLKIRAGFRAGMARLVNPKLKDPNYLLGVERGEAHYRKLLASREEERLPDYAFKGEPPLVFRGLMKGVSDTTTIRRRSTSRRPGLSEIEGSTFFESCSPELA